MIRHRTLIKIIIGIAIAAFILIAIYSGSKILTTLLAPKVDVNEDFESKTITKDGVEYFPKQDISVFMLMGIDREGEVKPATSYNNEGAADVVSLVVMDDSAKTYSVLMLNRDTMVDMPVLGVDGKKAGTINAQLALAHTYGTGMEDSCENVRQTVSDLLGGVEIDYYMSMNMDSIPIINDAVGGVKVNVTDDFSAVDPTIPMGEITLKGKQALTFIRNRKEVGDQMNLSRMSRQKEYMNGFISAVNSASDKKDTLAMDIYNKITPYVVSDCPISTFSNIMSKCSEYTLSEVVIPQGNNIKGEQYMEFHLDTKAFQDLTIDLFYSEKTDY